MLEAFKIILFLVCSIIYVLIWLFSAVIAWEFVEWLDRRKDRRKKRKGE